jgi:hypothetical protein
MPEQHFFCTRCGASNPSEPNYCSKCGMSFGSTPRMTQASAATVSSLASEDGLLARGIQFAVRLTVMGSIVVAILLYDHFKGPIFPDDLYCLIGVGDVTPGVPVEERMGTHSDGTPVTRWIHYGSGCHHGTILSALEQRYPSLRGLLRN